MVIKNGTSSLSPSDKAYVLPNWFLEQNVKTAQDLAATPDQMVFCNCDDCEETKLDDDVFEDEEQPGDRPDGLPLQEKDESGQTPDEMHYKTFAELRDVTCASFMPSRNGKLRQDSAVVFRIQEKDTSLMEPAWMSRVVEQVAKEAKTISMISFDLETLEELGCDFHHQDQEKAKERNSTTADWEPNMNSFTTFLEHFFAIQSRAKADEESWRCNQQALSTVLDAVKAVRAARPAEMGEANGDDAILIHIMDCSLVNKPLGRRVKRRVLTRFAETVRERREQGQAVTILLSTKSSKHEPGEKEFRKIGGTEGSIVTASGDKIHDLDQRNEIRTGILNTQRMRRLMRHHAPPDLFCAELLNFSSDWATQVRGKTHEAFGKKLWSSGEMNKTITRLIGRAWRMRNSRSQMSFSDICLMLERMGLFCPAESDAQSQATEETGEAGKLPPQEGQNFPPPLTPSTTNIENDSYDDDSAMGDNTVLVDVEPSAWPSVVSRARQEWEQQKNKQQQDNPALDSLMSLVGLEEVKSQFMAIKNLVDTARRQDANLAQEGFNAVFMGSPGSGKSTVAELYSQFLSVLGVIPKLRLEKTTGARLAHGGVDECRAIIRSIEETADDDDDGDDTNLRCKMRGVIFIDGAHNMVPDGANKTFNYLVDEIQRLQGQIIFLFAGPLKQMQSFVGLSPSLRSHVPFTFRFDDFADGELHQILVAQLRSKFQDKIRMEGGINGILMRILIRRIGRGRGSGYFANARDVQKALLHVLLRQADRLSQSRRLQEDHDDMYLTQTDLIGPPPVSALENSSAWKGLEGMTGLASVKQSVRGLITRLQTNYDRELAEEPPIETSLNKVFLGSPGTGKTTVAKYYAQILTELGLLSNGEVIVKSCHDFIGNHLGDSETLTKAILDSAQGKVLIIDEAYGLARDDQYSAAAIDTIVSEVQATATEDRAVLLLGYRDEMEQMFQRVNPGLGRRFPLSSAFEFHDFSDDELHSILEQKLKAQGFTASEEAKQVAMEVISRSRNHRNFGNAGEIDILLDRAKAAQQIRLNQLEGDSTTLITELEEIDFDADYDRKDRAESNIREAFASFVGAEALIARFQAYQRITQNSKDMGLDPRAQIPFNFIFRGPPGESNTCLLKVPHEINKLICCKRHWQNDHCPEAGSNILRHGLPSHNRSRSVLRKRADCPVRWPDGA